MPILNFILEGLFTVVEEPFRLVIAIPAIVDHDCSISLNGASPQSLGRGTYELRGVSNPKPACCFDPGSCLKLPADKVDDILTTAPPAYAVFILPRPNQIYPCRMLQRGKDVDFTGDDAQLIKATSFPLVDVLSYDFASLSAIQINGLPGFEAAYKPGTTYVNIKLFAASDGVTSAGHPSKAFRSMIQDLLPSIKLDEVVYKPGAGAAPPSNIPGVDPGELINRGKFKVDDCIKLIVGS